MQPTARPPLDAPGWNVNHSEQSLVLPQPRTTVELAGTTSLPPRTPIAAQLDHSRPPPPPESGQSSNPLTVFPRFTEAVALSSTGTQSADSGSEDNQVADPRVVDFLRDRFPARFAQLDYVAGHVNRWGTAYTHLLHMRMINGALRDLHMGTGNGERRERDDIQFEGSTLTFDVWGVVSAMRCSEARYMSWRGQLRLANSTYQWMHKYTGVWDKPTDQGREDRELYEALQAFFGCEPLPPMIEDGHGTGAVIDVPLAVQRARGWTAKAMDKDVTRFLQRNGRKRNTLPPPWALVD